MLSAGLCRCTTEEIQPASLEAIRLGGGEEEAATGLALKAANAKKRPTVLPYRDKKVSRYLFGDRSKAKMSR
jgi:hypothetical protein